jgi:hypothetical protein
VELFKQYSTVEAGGDLLPYLFLFFSYFNIYPVGPYALEGILSSRGEGVVNLYFSYGYLYSFALPSFF